VIATDSHTDNLTFYDLRKPTSLLNVCSLNRDFAGKLELNPSQFKKGSSSLHLTGTKLTVNSMSSQVLQYDLTRLATQPPLVHEGHKATFFVKSASSSPDGSLIASGS
jgi:WD40 repeat protein